MTTEGQCTLKSPKLVYSSESALAQPVKLIHGMCEDVWRSRELIAILFMRDLKAQFRQSYFGYLWLILPPLMTTAVWLFLSTQNVVAVQSPKMPYAVFVIIGTVLWQCFAGALQSPLKAFNEGKPVFMKLKVPPEAFIAAGSARAVFDSIISLALLVPVFVVYQIVPQWTIVLLPLAIVAMYLLGSAVGMLLLPVGGLYSDVSHAMDFILRFAMYLTPVVYPIPEHGIAGTLVRLNPVTPIIECARSWLVLGATDQVWPMLCWLPFSLIACLLGVVILRVVMPHIVARMGM